MQKTDRRQAVRDFKERRTDAGVYAVRCAATGEVWVAASRNIDAQQNSLWFGLRSGGHPNKAMQQAWMANGADAFTFEVLERIEAGDMTPMGVADHTKARERHWLAELEAKKAVG